MRAGKLYNRGLGFLWLILLQCSFTLLYGQQVTRQSAVEAFSKGDYLTAYEQFNELSERFSRDPLYKYYKGVTLVKMEKDPATAADMLRDATGGSVTVKSVPDDSWFYLGRALQMAGDYEKATDAYNQFTDKAGRKSAKEMNVQEYIDQCSRKAGKLSDESVDKSFAAVTVQPSGNNPPAPVPAPPVRDISPPKVQTITPVSPEYNARLEEALRFQFKADSVKSISEEIRRGMPDLVWSKRVELQKEIDYLDSLAAVYQKNADLTYSGRSVATTGQEETPVAVRTVVSSTVNTPAQPPAGKAVPVSRIEAGTSDVEKKESQQVTDLTGLTLFESDSRGMTVKINDPLPAGLVYLIQLAVFRNPVNNDYFKGLAPITGIRAAESERTYYYAGMFRQSADAEKALVVVRQKGFNDAFVVALLEGKQVSAERAALLEKEWGQRPFSGLKDVATVVKQTVAKDTIQTSLLFRVEVMRNTQPLKADALDSFKKLAGDRGYDILTGEKGMNIFLIGKFLNFTTATEYSDLLIRNGYKEAHVVAYIGKVEVPVETALKLFE